MVIFDFWGESFILGAVYFVIIIVPCIFLALIGRKIVYQLGHYPTKTALILKSFDFVKFIGVGSLALVLLIIFYFALGN